MTKKEKDNLKNEIQVKNSMTKKIGGWFIKSSGVCIFMAILSYWAFSGLEDSFLTISDGVRDVIKWISLVLAIGFGVFGVLSFLSYRNSKKHVLELIKKLNES